MTPDPPWTVRGCRECAVSGACSRLAEALAMAERWSVEPGGGRLCIAFCRQFVAVDRGH